MRWRTIIKGPDENVGRLNRAEVRAAIEAIRQEREAARSGSPVQGVLETPHEPHVQHASGEAP